LVIIIGKDVLEVSGEGNHTEYSSWYTNSTDFYDGHIYLFRLQLPPKRLTDHWSSRPIRFPSLFFNKQFLKTVKGLACWRHSLSNDTTAPNVTTNGKSERFRTRSVMEFSTYYAGIYSKDWEKSGNLSVRLVCVLTGFLLTYIQSVTDLNGRKT
jgi:hypothetical protein